MACRVFLDLSSTTRRATASATPPVVPKMVACLLYTSQEYFDLVEVMTCKTGCVGGAGQPYGLIPVKQQRAEGLYEADRTALIKRSERNPIVTKLLEGAMKGRTHQLLHVEYKRPDKA